MFSKDSAYTLYSLGVDIKHLTVPSFRRAAKVGYSKAECRLKLFRQLKMWTVDNHARSEIDRRGKFSIAMKYDLRKFSPFVFNFFTQLPK